MAQLKTDPARETSEDPGLDDYAARLAPLNAVPGWLLFADYFHRTPVPEIVPEHWSYRDLRPYVLEAGQVVSSEQAERRVVTLENPGTPGRAGITRTMTGGLQLVLPGEMAPTHRHTSSAFRFVIEGSLASTTVNGEKASMRPGDFVVTPPWAWHDHRNVGDLPMIWLDGLDLHLVNYFDAGFFENHVQREQEITRAEGTSDAEAGHNLLPVTSTSRTASRSPLYAYPYSRSREVLDQLSRSTGPDPWHAYKMKYTSPTTGTWPLPTIATTIQLLPSGFSTRPYRSTESAVFVVVEGHGESTIDGKRFAWEQHDIIVAPSWATHTHTAAADSVIFSYSDRAAHEALHLFREDRLWAESQ
ncbi:cupin domain-containing protein [Streptomyces phaeochromogenes]|uniref:cupin domain-containing protein n=1 Tax=Streptomyces phaeochromogenes TaxID=1923 RepID=UPI002DDB8ADE|nr:cupin domain-containing protein [Streptomyces phaeochromogenes]WRZ34514.1 cupin domain-containing protein [Streptomyces phaeochromogenes]